MGRYMQKHLLSIDPSIRSCGWAYFEGVKLKKSGTVKSTLPFIAASTAICDEIVGLSLEAHILVIEYPCYERSPRGKVCMLQGHTHNLAFLCGMLARALRPLQLFLPTPTQWKGQVPKSVTQARLKKLGYDFDSPDEADAMALGLWGLKTICG